MLSRLADHEGTAIDNSCRNRFVHVAERLALERLSRLVGYAVFLEKNNYPIVGRVVAVPYQHNSAIQGLDTSFRSTY